MLFWGRPLKSDQVVLRSASWVRSKLFLSARGGWSQLAIAINGNEQKKQNEQIFLGLNDENYMGYLDFGSSSISTINLLWVLGFNQENQRDFKRRCEIWGFLNEGERRGEMGLLSKKVRIFWDFFWVNWVIFWVYLDVGLLSKNLGSNRISLS
jgi:hypothetical protein